MNVLDYTILAVMGISALVGLLRGFVRETVSLLEKPNALAVGTWHAVRIEFKGPAITATVDGRRFAATSEGINEEKLTFGLGGDSGGPEGEKAGALEFRKLRITAR